MKAPYCDIPCADSILEFYDDWQVLDDDAKQAALVLGRYVLDGYYDCGDIDEAAPPDELRFANAHLAYAHTQGRLTTQPEATSVKSKRVKAGSVESETEYYTSGASGRVLIPKEVQVVLSDLCTRLSAGTRPLERV